LFLEIIESFDYDYILFQGVVVNYDRMENMKNPTWLYNSNPN